MNKLGIGVLSALGIGCIGAGAFCLAENAYSYGKQNAVVPTTNTFVSEDKIKQDNVPAQLEEVIASFAGEYPGAVPTIAEVADKDYIVLIGNHTYHYNETSKALTLIESNVEYRVFGTIGDVTYFYNSAKLSKFNGTEMEVFAEIECGIASSAHYIANDVAFFHNYVGVWSAYNFTNGNCQSYTEYSIENVVYNNGDDFYCVINKGGEKNLYSINLEDLSLTKLFDMQISLLLSSGRNNYDGFVFKDPVENLYVYNCKTNTLTKFAECPDYPNSPVSLCGYSLNINGLQTYTYDSSSWNEFIILCYAYQTDDSQYNTLSILNLETDKVFNYEYNRYNDLVLHSFNDGFWWNCNDKCNLYFSDLNEVKECPSIINGENIQYVANTQDGLILGTASSLSLYNITTSDIITATSYSRFYDCNSNLVAPELITFYGDNFQIERILDKKYAITTNSSHYIVEIRSNSLYVYACYNNSSIVTVTEQYILSLSDYYMVLSDHTVSAGTVDPETSESKTIYWYFNGQFNFVDIDNNIVKLTSANGSEYELDLDTKVLTCTKLNITVAK